MVDASGQHTDRAPADPRRDRPGTGWPGTNLPRVGGYNRSVVLDAIRRSGGISRVELAQHTGLTAQTMSNIVRTLIDGGLVAEDGRGPSTGGKRRVLLRVVPDAHCAVGLHLDPERITGVLLDLSGAVRVRSTRRMRPGAGPRAALGDLTRTYQQLLRGSGIGPAQVLGLGLAVPGPLDRAHRQLLHPPNLAGWAEIALADQLQERAGSPVVMDTDGTAAAIGERWAGGSGSFICVHVGSGVSTGVVLGGQVHRGTSSNAGEIGHVAGPSGRPCHCGKRGCLEAYCSMRAMLEQWRDSGGTPSAGTVAGCYEQLCRSAASGDRTAARVLRRAITRLGHVLASVVSVLDVDQVVLDGPALRHVGDLVRAQLASVLEGHVWAHEIRPVRVRAARGGEDAGAIGAAALVLDRTYSPQLRTLLDPELLAPG